MRVEDPVPPDVRLTLVGLTDAARPEGETDVVNDTLPEKPFWLVRVMVGMAWPPVGIVKLTGLLEIVKSGEELATVTVFEITPTAPTESVTDRCTL